MSDNQTHTHAAAPEEWRERVISALDAVVCDRWASEVLSDKVLPLFAEEAERAESRIAELEAEVARLRAGESDQPPAEAVALTSAEWIHCWNRATAEKRLAMVDTILTAFAGTERCLLMDHDGLQAELDSARRRIQHLTAQVDRAQGLAERCAALAPPNHSGRAGPEDLVADLGRLFQAALIVDPSMPPDAVELRTGDQVVRVEGLGES